jgi:transcription elongation GreA/GreB family factor
MEKRKVIEEVETYLKEEMAQANPEQAQGLGRLLLMYRFLPKRNYEPHEVIAPGALVELMLGRMRTFCLIVPHGGGLVLRVEEHPVQVITPDSPLGEALLGKKAGDRVSVTVGSGAREYEVIGVS